MARYILTTTDPMITIKHHQSHDSHKNFKLANFIFLGFAAEEQRPVVMWLVDVSADLNLLHVHQYFVGVGFPELQSDEALQAH